MTAPFDAIAVGTEIQRRIGVKTSRDEPLARFTTMRVGGPADLFATVHNTFELKAIVRFARVRGLPHLVLGRASDVVISDAGVRGLVICNRAEGSKVVGDTYRADAGVSMARAATETQKAGLSGLEFGLAIPGTVGGAVWANAGAHGSDMAAVLVEDEALDADRLVEVASLLADPARHALMSAAARDQARPGAAAAVGDLVIALALRDQLPSASEIDAEARGSGS